MFSCRIFVILYWMAVWYANHINFNSSLKYLPSLCRAFSGAGFILQKCCICLAEKAYRQPLVNSEKVLLLLHIKVGLVNSF
jgi:hypothetical protein